MGRTSSASDAANSAARPELVEEPVLSSSKDREARPDPLVEHAGLTTSELESVLALVAGSDVVELEVSFGSAHFKLRRPPNLSISAPPSERADIAAPPASLAIASPLVGIFHPTVKPGDNVVQGQAIGAIEALGMPASVDAPQAGIVDDLLVQDGSPVEYGQPLIVLRR